jgi:hypothetical protein
VTNTGLNGFGKEQGEHRLFLYQPSSLLFKVHSRETAAQVIGVMQSDSDLTRIENLETSND